jgi:hypothetical protein
MDDERRRIAALETWKVYRRWAAASAAMKRRRDLLTRVVFWLGLLGLVLGPVATHRPPVGPEQVLELVALASGIAVALNAYLSDKVLGSDPDVAWVRARQAAEGLKSLALTFLMRATPFGAGDEAGALDAARTRVEEALTSLVALPIPEADAARGFPPFPLSVERYVESRAREQQRWFEGRVVENHRAAGRLQLVTKSLGAIAAVLAVPAAFRVGLGGWVAVVTAFAGALGAQVTAGRHRFLEKSYHDAAARLARAITRWETSPRRPEDDGRLVGDCERTLRDENAAWVEFMLRKDGAGPSASGGAGLSSPPPAPGAG